MDPKTKYGMYRGKWIADMSRDELLEVILIIGEENWKMRTKPCVHEELEALAKD